MLIRACGSREALAASRECRCETQVPSIPASPVGKAHTVPRSVVGVRALVSSAPSTSGVCSQNLRQEASIGTAQPGRMEAKHAQPGQRKMKLAAATQRTLS